MWILAGEAGAAPGTRILTQPVDGPPIDKTSSRTRQILMVPHGSVQRARSPVLQGLSGSSFVFMKNHARIDVNFSAVLESNDVPEESHVAAGLGVTQDGCWMCPENKDFGALRRQSLSSAVVTASCAQPSSPRWKGRSPRRTRRPRRRSSWPHPGTSASRST